MIPPFPRFLVNRLQMPTKHVLVCEDTLEAQVLIAQKFQRLLPYQGHVQVSFVAGANAAWGVLQLCDIDLILLDHDMPDGNGPDFLVWLRESNHRNIPVMTFSGIEANNDHLMTLGAAYRANKDKIVSGECDEFFRRLLSEG